MMKTPQSMIRAILYYGVIGSAILLTIGSLAVFATGGFLSDSLGQLTVSSTDGWNLLGAFSLNGSLTGISRFLMGSGVLVLVAIPVSRAIMTVFLFAQQKDKKYVIMTSIVILILMVSYLVVGPMEAGYGI